jgi:predicted metallopeptidase
MRRKSQKKVIWEKAPDIQKRIKEIISTLEVPWLNPSGIYSFRSQNTSTRAYARIWGLPRVFQLAMDLEPSYVIEVISEKFDRLPSREQDKILIHELVHIPSTFSGSLSPHTHARRGRRGFEDRVRELVDKYNKG